MRKILLTIFLILAAANFSCVSAGTATKYRYISLAPSTTEILFSLRLNEEIVAVSSYCDYPPQAKAKEKVGDFSHPNMEIILSLKPDYVFCTGLEQASIAAELKKMNLKVYIADPSNLEELFTTIRDIGKITYKTEAAETLVQQMQDRISKVKQEAQLIPPGKRPKVFVEIWHDPLTTAGKGSFIDELITIAGGINIAHNTRRPYSIFSPEEVIKADPDCIILAYMDSAGPIKLIESRAGWKGISALKNKRVYNDIAPELVLRPGPRLVIGLEEVYRRIKP